MVNCLYFIVHIGLNTGLVIGFEDRKSCDWPKTLDKPMVDFDLI